MDIDASCDYCLHICKYCILCCTQSSGTFGLQCCGCGKHFTHRLAFDKELYCSSLWAYCAPCSGRSEYVEEIRSNIVKLHYVSQTILVYCKVPVFDKKNYDYVSSTALIMTTIYTIICIFLL